jgi:hypothetical protein
MTTKQVIDFLFVHFIGGCWLVGWLVGWLEDLIDSSRGGNWVVENDSV